MHYQTLDQLQRFKAQLLNTVKIGSGMQLAHWSNNQDQVHVCSDHHTLSLYVRGGYDTYRKTNTGWENGGAPDHFCLMPQHTESTWDIRGDLSFVHLYYTQQHLEQVVTQIWDKEPRHIHLTEQNFVLDEKITSLYRQFITNNDWQQGENLLEMSTAATLLLTHIIKQYSNTSWHVPQLKGGLSTTQRQFIIEWIHHHLDTTLTISELAQTIGISEYHFAHLFTISMGIPPHQYVMQQRLTQAHADILMNHQTLTDIAFKYGFSSSSHFSYRFKKFFGYSPSSLRQSKANTA
ncbi:helix-turn-helix transcriptional regulator [Acinetobacter rathckeae]|uniref:helix-turn-helix transcriptional regulator n=1 Tax=Acinetobacter rathckeae TaxID=2605272 RepID=UPI0018A2CCFC|nr:helix-turn-helix domain-containing protein [Acinetobacter rathckeae]MBF7689032.1 helix-turn-helix transcriptional regulator [Acinetobacter rathckeae]